jgi:predicted  nucleic acid-binding Zn-ribbon protein
VKVRDEEKRALLKVQEIDLESFKLISDAQKIPEAGETVDLQEKYDLAQKNLAMIRATEIKYRNKANEVAGQIQTNNVRSGNLQKRLDDGDLSAKHTESTVKELKSIQKTNEKLEVEHAELVERIDTATGLYQRQKNIGDRIKYKWRRTVTGVNNVTKGINNELLELRSARDEYVKKINPEAYALYNSLQTQHKTRILLEVKGYEVIGLSIELTQGERDTIINAPADELIQLDDYGLLAVKTEEVANG